MLEARIEHAARTFLAQIADDYDIGGAVVYGSRARGDDREDSDVDLAVLLRGSKGDTVKVARHMARAAFDIMMDTGVLIEPLPIWLEDWEHPERFGNPPLIDNIRREGVPL